MGPKVAFVTCDFVTCDRNSGELLANLLPFSDPHTIYPARLSPPWMEGFPRGSPSIFWRGPRQLVERTCRIDGTVSRTVLVAAVLLLVCQEGPYHTRVIRPAPTEHLLSCLFTWPLYSPKGNRGRNDSSFVPTPGSRDHSRFQPTVLP